MPGSVIINDETGTPKGRLTLLASEIDRAINQQDTARVQVPLEEASNEANVTPGLFEVEILDRFDSTVFRGRLKNTVQRNDVAEFTVASFREDARRAEPSAAKQQFEGATDAAVARDAISRVPTLSEGTIQNIEADVTVTFQHATPARQLRKLRKLTKGIVRFNDDKTVDYVSDIGGTPSEVLRPANRNITSFTVEEAGGDSVLTHLRMIGGSGASIDVVADSYANGDIRRWDKATHRDVSDVRNLQRLGESLLSELQEEFVEVRVTATGPNITPDLGDEYDVVYDERGIDATLTVTELTERRDNEGVHYDLLLTNRPFARQRDLETMRRDVSQLERTSQTQAAENRAGESIPKTNVPAGKFITQTVELPANHEFNLWNVNQAPFVTGVRAQVFVGGNTSPLYELSGEARATGQPLAQTGAESFARPVEFRLFNTTSSEQNVGASWTYTIEQTRA